MRRRLLTATAITCLTVAACMASTAQAAFFAGTPVDDARVVGDLDLSRDGTGGVAYLKSVDGVDHVFVSRFVNGVFQPPERVDTAFGGFSGQPVIAAGPGGRLAVVFTNGGFVHAVVRPEGKGFAGPIGLGDGSNPSVDMAVNGAGIASFTSNSGDVRAARLDRKSNVWSTLGGVADLVPGNSAGTGNGRSKVAISADGVGVVTWGESGRVHARKIFVASGFSTSPQTLTPPTFDGKASVLGELPDIDAEEDSSYAWVVFRQVLAGGAARILARRQRGTTFDPPIGIDVGDEPGSAPRIEITPRGVGLAAMSGATSRQPMAATLDKRDNFSLGTRIFSPAGVEPTPAVAIADNDDGLIAAVQGSGQGTYVRVRPYLEGVPQPEVNLSNNALGPVGDGNGLVASADRNDSFIVAWIQGGKLVAGYGDRPPGTFVGYTRRKCCVAARAKLTWQRAFELWGPLRYEVYVDGKLRAVSSTASVKLPKKLKGINHKWQVIARDVRGQFSRTKSRKLVVDDLRPRQNVKYKRKGRRVTLTVRGKDIRRKRHKTSGIGSTVFTWGDGRKTTKSGRLGRASHRYKKSGTFTLTITTRDKAGNETTRKRKVRVG